MKAMTRCLAFVGALVALTSSHAATPTAVWSGTDLADNVTQGGMTLHLNGNTAADGVITIGSSAPVYIDTGLTSSSENAGTELTLVVTMESVNTSQYSGLFTFTSNSQVDSIGLESYYSFGTYYGLCGVRNSSYCVDWENFAKYPTDGLSHKIGFAYAGPESGTGTGGYKGCYVAVDAATLGSCASLVNEGQCMTRINIGGYQNSLILTGAKITRIAVYTSALSEADLLTATGEEDPEPEDPGYDEEVLASFFGFDELTSGNYTADVNGNTVVDGKVTISKGAIKLTSSETWTGTDVGISVLVKYSDFVQPSANAALVTLKNSAAGTMDSGVGVSSIASTAKIQGIWQNKVWTTQACDNSIAASGYIVLVYKGKVGTTLYDGSGNILYQAPKLVSSNSQTIGDVLTIGALGDNTLPATDMVIEGARIFKGALSADEITAAVEDFEADFPEPEPEEELSQMYLNRLSGEEVIPAGEYGKISVSGGGFKATAYTIRTQLSGTAIEGEIEGSYADITKKISSDTDTATHTFAGWFKLDSDTQDIYYALNSQTDGHNGYKVAVSAGKIQVGKTAQFGWNTASKDDAPGGCVSSQEAVITSNQWYHIAVSVTKTADKRSATPVVFVNGEEIAMEEYNSATKKFATNLNNSECTYVGIAAGVSAAGIYVDNAALATSAAVVKVALSAPTAIPEALSPMYKNRLSAGAQTLPAGMYGAITVPEGGFWATAFDAATDLANVESDEEIVGSYTDIITHTDMTDVRVHTFAGWFKLDALPEEEGVDNVKTIYAAKAVDGTHGGYKVAVDNEGKIYVGKCGNEDWTGDDRIVTAAAQVEAGEWFHLAVSIPGCVDSSVRNSTATIFVNGEKVETTGTTFATNLDGNECIYVRLGTKGVTSGLGLSASGIYVDTAALTTSVAVVQTALTTPLSTSETPAAQAEITKDESTHTWIVDTTKAAYSFTSAEIAELGATAWKVTLKSQSDYSATINFGERSGSQPSHYIFESGTHNFTWIGTVKTLNFNKTGTADDPSILVKSGATLNFTARDITGWNGAATAKYWNLIRVNEGGTLNILPSGTMTHYYQGRYWFDPGATVNVGEYESYEFRLNGGTNSGYEELYVPDSDAGSLPVELTVATGFKAASDTTAGVGIYVGENSTLNINGDVGSDSSAPIVKRGAGTLVINGSTEYLAGTLTVDGGVLKLTKNVIGGSLVANAGATVDLTYDGVVADGAVVLKATSVDIENATLRVNGVQVENAYFEGGKLVLGNPPISTCLNPYAVKDGETIKVSCNAEATAGEAAKAFDDDTSTYFAPGDTANAKGVSWTGIEFTNGVIVTRITYSSATNRRIIGGAFQGANLADFSDAINIHVVESYSGGTADVTLDEAKGPYKYLRFMGMYGGNVSEIKFYGLAESGDVTPTVAPTVVKSWSTDGVAGFTLQADAAIPQVFIVQRAMADFCDDDDYETFVSLAPQIGKTVTWNDSKATGYAKYRVKGFNANGESAWAYFDVVPEKLISGYADKPTFVGNLPGFYENQAVVEITYNNPNAKIYYTTDGSTPTTNSTPYESAITLVDVCSSRTNELCNIPTNPEELWSNTSYGWRKPTADQPNVNIIRARAFLPDGSASKFDVAGTWMIGTIPNDHPLRVVSIQTDYDNYFGDAKGIMVPGDIYKAKGFGSHSVGMPNANYFQSGTDWERPVQIQIFETNRTEMLSAQVGTRVRGFWSRSASKKSLTCYFRKEYGTKNVKAQLFGDEGVKKFKRFILRNGGNDWYMLSLRDAVGQSMFRGYVSTGTQGYEPSVLYINGEYWGLYDFRHCYSKHHFEEWGTGVGDDIDYVKLTPEDGTHFEVQEGDLNEMWNIMQYMITHTEDDSVMDDEEFAYVSNRVDIADMIDYHIVNIFLGNNDWMSNGNNMGYWRNRTGDDQKWHFTVYDCDSAMSFGGDSYSSDHLSSALSINDSKDSNTKMAPGFLKRCFYNEGFKKQFANRYADLLNTALAVDRMTNIVAVSAARVEPEIERTVARWTNMGSYSTWKSRLTTFNKFFLNRPTYQWKYLKSKCSSGDLVNISLAANEGLGNVKLNTIESGKHFELPFTGQYFTDIPVTLTATPESGYEFSGWKVGDEIVSEDAEYTFSPTSGLTVQAVFTEKAKSEQEMYLRLWGFCGAPSTGGADGPGEFIILTNLNSEASLDLEGAYLNICKHGEDYEIDSSCRITFPAGWSIDAGGYLRIEKVDGLDGWTKIQNGDLKIMFKAANGGTIYNLEDALSQKSKGVKEEDKFLKAVAFNQTTDDWVACDNSEAPVKPVPPEPIEDVVLTGNYAEGTNIVLKGDTTIIVSNATFGAGLTFTSNCVATVMLPEGTTSTIPQITAEGNLVFDGTGCLTMTGASDLLKIGGNLEIAGGEITFNLNATKAKAAIANNFGSYVQTGGRVTVNLNGGVQAYGFRWKDVKGPTVTISGGEFIANVSSGDGSAAFKGNKGSNDFTLSGGTLTATLNAADASVADMGGNVKINGTAVANVTGAETATHARVFKTEKKVTISDTADIDVKVPGLESEAFSADNQITIEGGVTRVDAGDDCFSAQTNIVISGGVVYGHSVSNDVFDSNGQMTISGGTVIAYTLAEGHEAFDTEPATADEQDHTFTISGGSVVGLGGKNSAWPTTYSFTQNTEARTDVEPTTYSDKYLVVDGTVETLYAKLPVIADTFSLLATTKGKTEDAATAEAPAGKQVATDVPAWVVTKHNQQSLRFAVIYGNTADGIGGDTGEYFVLTNISENAVYLNNLEIEITKSSDKKSKSKCNFKASGDLVVEPHGSYKFEQAAWGWTKITNGDLRLVLTDSDANEIQSGETSNDFFPECDGNGASLMAKTFGTTLAMTQGDWEPSFRWYYFTSDDAAATITGFGTTKLAETTLTIPRELGKVPVTTIAENAFTGCALTTLKVTLTNETLKVLGTGGASIATYDMSESEGELVLGYALGSTLNVSGTTVLGTSAATLAFDLGEGVKQEVSGTTSDAAKLYGLTIKSGILGFSTTNGSATPFRDRIVTADGSNAVVKVYSKTDTTGYDNPAVKIVAKNGGQFQIGKRDTLVAPVELCDGEVKLLAGCADNSRGLDLYNANGNNWSISGNSIFSVDSNIGSGNGRKVFLRNGSWNIDVAADSIFTVAATLTTSLSGSGTRGKIVKTGAGTLYLAATDSDYTTATEIQEGTLRIADNELQGALVMSAGTALDLHYDGTPTHGTIVLTAASLTIPDDVTITVDGVPYLFAKSETTLTIDRAVAQVNGKAYGTIVDAAKAAGDGGVMTLLLSYETLKDEIDAAAITLTPGEGENVYTNNFKWAVGTSLIITEIMPKPTDGEYDVNGVTSGWVELQNTTNAWVDLKDYKFIRVNRSKANSKGDYGNFPSDLIGPTATYTFLTSERYANSADSSVSAWEHGTFDGKPVKYGADLNNVMVWGDKVNPKKFCFVRLYYAPNGTEESIVDTVVIPSDLPESWSIKVDQVKEGVATTRWMQPRTSAGEIDSTQDLVKIGPNVGPLYEIADGKKHTSASEFGAVLPAKIGEDYAITFALNPVMHPTETQSKNGNFRDEDAITNITLVYRTKLSDTTVSTNVDLATQKWDAKDLGYTYQATIPHEAFDSIGDGQLIQWKFVVADKGGNTWTTPSFNNKDDGYEWYGTITEPSAAQMSAKLPTWHMFADSASLADMDKDADDQSLTYNARVAIYDSSTSNYYDYVRIDLRGNTTKNFKKKSHGFRFAKAHPLTMTDVITGETVEEIRKTSLIAEYCDPTYLRQLTSFWIWRQVGNNVPFDFPTRANLNGAFYQLGFNSERFTDELVEDVYGLDKYGYSYKSVGTLQSGGGTTAGGIEKKTPDDGDESDVSVLQSELRALITAAGNVPGTTTAAKSSETTDPTGLDNAALTKVVVQKFDLPAWINYLASARITQECDDVWGNLCMFYDKPEMKEGTRGTGTWMPLGYDFNLSLGQHYMDGSVPRNGLKANYDWFKSHPFYGGHRVRCWNQKELSSTINYGNYGFEAVWQSAKFRRLYLRRLRTLMDQLLKEPGTPAEEVPIMAAVNTFAELIAEDAVTDRAAWPINSSANAINVWGVDNFPASVAAGIEDLWTNYVQLRQKHLYVTHSVTNDALVTGYGTNLKAGIPLAQSDIATLKPSFGYELIDGGIKITNSGDEVIDISGWVLGGPVAMTIPNGTVLDAKQGDANGEVYIVTNRIAYCAANVDALTDQVIVGNATPGVEGSDVTLKTANGEDVIVPDTKSEQEKYLRLWGFCGAPDEFDEDKGEFFILTNFNQTAALDVGGLDLNFCGADKLDSESKCHIVLNDGLTIPAGGWLRICLTDTDKFTGTWTKIANHQQRITICDNAGVRFIYFECVDQDALGVYCNGYALRYDFPTESWQRMLISDMPGSKPAVESILITGDYPNGTNIVLTADANFIISNATFGAALTFTSNFVATVQVPEGTASTLPKIDAADADIVLDGTGTLTVSNNAQLIACAGLTIKDIMLNLDLFGDMTDTMVAAEMSGSYLQQGGTVILRMSCTNTGKKKKSLYGFRWKDKPDCTVTIEQGGVFHTELYNDSNAVAFKANDPSNAVLLDEAVITGSFTGVDGRFVDTKGTLTIKGGSDIDVTNATTDTSIFKADGKIALKKLTAKVKATGAGSKVFSTEDSIEAGHDDLVLYLVSQDKCFNAETNITFTKGVVYCQSVAGNAFSTNATFTITGGTVVALGGTDSAWPNVCNIEQSVYTNNACAAEAYSNKYLVLDGEFATTTVRMPEIAETFTMLASVKSMTGDPTTSETEPEVEPVAEGVPVWIETKSPQQFLRFYEIYGNTAEGEGKSAGDVGEYFVLTNMSSELTVDLTGLKINIEKLDDWTKKQESGSKCLITLEGGEIAPGESMRFDQSVYTNGWTKITNGDLYIALTDSDGVSVQTGTTSNDLFPECNGKGASLIAKTFGKTIAMTVTDWKPSFAWFIFTIADNAATITDIGESLQGEEELTLPTELGKVPVTAVADGAFAKCANLRRLVFVGTPLECTSAAFPEGVIATYDSAQTGWVDEIVDGKWNGLVMLNGKEETISVNIGGGRSYSGAASEDRLMSGTNVCDLIGVQGINWNNVAFAWNTATTKTLTDIIANCENVAISRTNVTVSAYANNTWTYGATATILRGYLDDGGSHAQITVLNVPYTKYDVVIYGNSDGSGKKQSPITVNGVSYTWADGETVSGTATWGAGCALEPRLGQNALWIPSQTAVTLKIVGGANANGARGGIAAIQIVNRGEIDDAPGKDFSGYMDKNATLETVTWENGPFEAGRKNTATIQLASKEELTLTLSDPLVLLKQLAITGDGDLWISASEYPKNIATLDLGVNGRVTYGWPVYALESSTDNVAYAGGAGSAESPVLLNPKGGNLWLRGGTYYIANSSWSGTSTTVDIDDSVLDFGDGCFGVGTATYTIGGASEVTTKSFVLSQGGGGRTAVLTLEDNASLTVTGNTIVDSNQSSIMFGHWNGSSTFTIKDNATFNAPDAQVLVGKTGNNHTINIEGGIFTTYGIKAAGNASGSNKVILSGGELRLGSGGISSYSTSRTIAVSVTNDAQITAFADTTIDQAMTVSEGVTLKLGSENGATFTITDATFANASSGTIAVVEGNVTLDGAGVLGDQKLRVDEGATVTITLTDFGEIPEEGVKPFEVEAGDVETFKRVKISDGAQHPYVTFDTDPTSETFGKLLYKAPTCELTGLHIAEICGKPTEKDPNGRESGWVELVNYGPDAVNLKDYKLYRLNYGKKDKHKDAMMMLDREVGVGERTLVYMSEDYPTAEDYGGDGATIKNYGLVDGQLTEDAPNSIMVIPTKINPKKYPSVMLYGSDNKAIDTVVVPCEIDDNGSVVVGVTTNKIERFVTFTPTPMTNKNFSTAIAIGPEVNGLYGTKDYLTDLASLNQHAGFAAAGASFKVRMPINPVCGSDLAANKIKSVRLIYRVFDPAGSQVKSVAMTKGSVTDEEKAVWGKSGVWEGEIPAEDMIAGKLVQYAAMITDGSGVEWRAPRFVYPELGYEWYGVVVDPGETVNTSKLQTFLMFIDNTNKAQMDTDSDKQTLATGARMAIYDTQTHTYYDNVRIDLRGNTSAGFTKKSHGLRFNKVAPLVCTDPTTDEALEVRKTSFISEFADPTYMRQMLSFWLLREAGCKVPFDYPVRVYMNGEFYQLAFHSERFSDDLIENVYGLNPYVYSYKNIGTFGGGTTAGGIEKKTPDDDNEKDLTLLNAYVKRFNAAKNGASLTDAQKEALDHTIVTNFDLSAWINYIAATKITTETDDVWANLSGYIDYYDSFYNKKGDNMLYPLAYDMNLSWGQFYRAGMTQNGLYADKDWFKSHPYYGGFVIFSHSSEGGTKDGKGNYAFETVFQNPRNREMLVRRMRTLMDKFLGAPGTAKEDTRVWQQMQYYADLMSEDAAIDRAKWPIDSSAGVVNVWGSNFPASFEAGLADLWDNYIVPRRVHLYDTHSVTNTAKALGYGADLNAGIPLAQASAASFKDVIDIANIGNDGLFHDENVLVITNKSNETVDISDWQLKYSVTLTIPGGTVIPANGCVYVPANRRAFVEGLVADGVVDDQIITASATFNVSGAIALVADDGTEVVKHVPTTNENEYLRLHSFCGNTAEGEGDVGEWFVLTNISNEVELDLEGVTVCFLKEGDPEEGTAHCHVTFEKGKIAAGASQRFNQADYADKGWIKIQNNKLGINIYDFYGSVCQNLAVAQKDYPEAYGGGGWLVADSTAKVVGKKEWHVETAVVPVQPGESPEMKAKTEEEAIEEISKYEVKLTEEDKTAGVDPDTLVMTPVAVTNESTGAVTYHAQVAINPLVVEEPEVGSGTSAQEEEVKPIVVTPDGEGNTTVSVGINNATMGLWYGYEVSDSMGTQNFANDVDSFRRADGPAISIEGSPRTGNAAFFRVKVLPAKPTE